MKNSLAEFVILYKYIEKKKISGHSEKDYLKQFN